MPNGTLEVFLQNAKGLKDTDWLTRMDPYAVITCRTQEKKSDVISGGGSNPEWNETFIFKISTSDVQEIAVKIMDKDTFKSDDFVGAAIIPLREVFCEGEVPIRSYKVVKNDKYSGEIKIGLTFKSESERGSAHRRKSSDGYRGSDEEEEAYDERRQSRDDYGGSDEDNYGGYRESRDDY